MYKIRLGIVLNLVLYWRLNKLFVGFFQCYEKKIWESSHIIYLKNSYCFYTFEINCFFNQITITVSSNLSE